MHRGGNGLSVAYHFLCDGDIGIHDERWLTYPWGVLGGDTGMRSTKKLVRVDGSEEWLPAKVEGIKVKEGDVLYFNTWGGGGWGNPLERDPALVRTDVERRLVSSEGAKRYGVVLDDSGSVDASATETLRKKWRASDQPKQSFSTLVVISKIFERACEAETNLPAPVKPVFIGANAK